MVKRATQDPCVRHGKLTSSSSQISPSALSSPSSSSPPPSSCFVSAMASRAANTAVLSELDESTLKTLGAAMRFLEERQQSESGVGGIGGEEDDIRRLVQDALDLKMKRARGGAGNSGISGGTNGGGITQIGEGLRGRGGEEKEEVSLAGCEKGRVADPNQEHGSRSGVRGKSLGKLTTVAEYEENALDEEDFEADDEKERRRAHTTTVVEMNTLRFRDQTMMTNPLRELRLDSAGRPLSRVPPSRQVAITPPSAVASVGGTRSSAGRVVLEDVEWVV